MRVSDVSYLGGPSHESKEKWVLLALQELTVLARKTKSTENKDRCDYILFSTLSSQLLFNYYHITVTQINRNQYVSLS